jgi:hypothetical protein
MRKTMRKAVRLMFLLISYCAVLLVIANATDGSTMSSVRIDLPNGDYIIETISDPRTTASYCDKNGKLS